MKKQAVLGLLKGGDRRSIGPSKHVVALIRRCPTLFPVLIDGMHDADGLVRRRTLG